MSLNDFRQRALIDLKITIEGSGEFDPNEYAIDKTQKIAWTLSGTILPKTPVINLTIKEKTCSSPQYVNGKEYIFFGIRGSVGSNSGTIEVGRIEPVSRVTDKWVVNTDPVLSDFGKINGEYPTVPKFFVVQAPDPLPSGTTVDDPIPLAPTIDGIKRVYPGDIIYNEASGFSRWTVIPKTRFPLPDRTFTWNVNSAPTIASGGMVNGELAKVGTIMLPDSTTELDDEAESIDGKRYFYQNFGVQFDGQRWNVLHTAPSIITPEEGPKKIRNVSVQYLSPSFFERDLEEIHRNKCFVYSNIDIDENSTCSLTYEGMEAIALNFGRWGGSAFGLQAPGGEFYDFGDAWSKYHLSNQNWKLENNPPYAGFPLFGATSEGLIVIEMGAITVDGEKYTFTTESIDSSTGDTLTNTFTVTYQAKTSKT